jgi:hypothetical protein
MALKIFASAQSTLETLLIDPTESRTMYPYRREDDLQYRHLLPFSSLHRFISLHHLVTSSDALYNSRPRIESQYIAITGMDDPTKLLPASLRVLEIIDPGEKISDYAENVLHAKLSGRLPALERLVLHDKGSFGKLDVQADDVVWKELDNAGVYLQQGRREGEDWSIARSDE